MKHLSATLLLISASLVLLGQGTPDWVDSELRRARFPENTFFTGFAYGELSAGRQLHDVRQQMITDAQADLSRMIRVQIISRSQSEMSAASSGGRYSESESFTIVSATESSAEAIGVKTESYYDESAGIVYALAYVNRIELSAYHKTSIARNLAQAEAYLQTSNDLEASCEKIKARHQCEAAESLLDRIQQSQVLLTAIGGSASESLQQTQTEALRNRIVQRRAQLAITVVHVESAESNFSQPTTVAANRLKSLLAAKGCSFIDDPAQADFLVNIEATTRFHSSYPEYGITVCFAAVSVVFFDVCRNVSVFKDEFSQRGSSPSTQEITGRVALEEAASTIANKILQWLE